MKFVVTGGLGFIGSCLVNKLLKLNHEICIIDRRDISLAIKNNPLISSWIHLFTCSNPIYKLVNSDIADIDLSFLCNYDVVVHLAANPGVQLSVSNPLQDLQANLLNTVKVLEALRNIDIGSRPSLIFSSSAAPLAGNDVFPLHENLPHIPLSPYGASKASCENYIRAYNNTYHLNGTILRFSNVYGPGSLAKSSVVSNMIKCGLKSNNINIFGSGNQTRDFIYINDLVNCILFASKASFVSKPIHVSTGVSTSISKVAELVQSILCKKTGKSTTIKYLPALKADAAINYSSPSLLYELGFPELSLISSKLISFTVDYYLEHSSVVNN